VAKENVAKENVAGKRGARIPACRAGIRAGMV
jgi:hypothetical protein